MVAVDYAAVAMIAVDIVVVDMVVVDVQHPLLLHSTLYLLVVLDTVAMERPVEMMDPVVLVIVAMEVVNLEVALKYS